MRLAGALLGVAVVISNALHPFHSAAAGVAGAVLAAVLIYLGPRPRSTSMLRIPLTELDFRLLVAGEIVRKAPDGQPIELALQDIGFERMVEITIKASASGIVDRFIRRRAP